MIRNEREHRITNAAAEKFRTAIAQATAADPSKGVHQRLHQASIDGMKAKLADLEQELADYRALQKGRLRAIAGTLDRIGEVLIKARIARGWTQRQLGARLGLQMQKIQEYEATTYERASATRLLEVARALGLVVHLRGELLALPELAPALRQDGQPAETPANPKIGKNTRRAVKHADQRVPPGRHR